MERVLILLVATVVVFVAPGVQGTAHLSFDVNGTVLINRTGCGVSKFCLETPADCNPAENSTCLFGSALAGITMAPSGLELALQISGNSSGYIALGLTPDATQGITQLFVCIQNSSDEGSFSFRTVDRNNTSNGLTPSETRVREIRGTVTGDIIRCEFNVTNVNISNISVRMSQDTFNIILGSGPLDGANLGKFTVALTSPPLNISNLVNNTTVNTAGSALQSHAVLLLLSLITLSVLKAA
ncbi:putative ferric-chelate reductase 1 [Brachyistius frenatus]|uniref:putative ferric-chelate reductase 1 n=1 Tax=Brachyistius frenatus TaxID=100188 RepID=UPI0037E8AF26